MRYGLKMFGVLFRGVHHCIVYQFRLEYFKPLPFPADACPAVFDLSVYP